jgi:hypothetical protein
VDEALKFQTDKAMKGEDLARRILELSASAEVLLLAQELLDGV